ncbi:hypothetical protein [Paenibacillus xylanilyticus]|uniref:Uncharacterized protein n=1 Tax=Paenibacillus xylanilyticus TaxID=248903 RepID=A0A7Y6BT78_9BACL|nr:hypothetical protein [Paenibacillus xylanilyticus]NUU74376.1 hypothetical protein [Paenibacillus xylanilyticus]
MAVKINLIFDGNDKERLMVKRPTSLEIPKAIEVMYSRGRSLEADEMFYSVLSL